VLHIQQREFIQNDKLFYNGLFKLIIIIGFYNPRGKSRSMDRGKGFTMKYIKTEGHKKCKHNHQTKDVPSLIQIKKNTDSNRPVLNVATGLIA
jgi:hypothetical protein